MDRRPAIGNGEGEDKVRETGSPAPGSPYEGVEYDPGRDEIASSGQAKVFRGRREGRDVAVKVFHVHRDDRRDYKAELWALMRVGNHDNLIDILDFFESPNPCIVMPLVAGCTLMDHLGRKAAAGASLTDGEVGRVALGIAEGPHHLHRAGFVPRDIKTPNIMKFGNFKRFSGANSAKKCRRSILKDANDASQ